MSPFPLTIILISTVFHAAWNLLARRQRAETRFFGRMLLAVVALGLIPAAFSEWQARSLTLQAWLYVTGSGIFCAFYYFFLARGYRSSDFTVVYPIARALPVLLVALGDVLRGRYPTPAGWLGMLLVVAGCFLIPLHSFREISRAHYLNRSSLWMGLTALGTVGYTLLDKAAAEFVPPGPATAARYEYAFYLVSCLAYLAIVHVADREQSPLAASALAASATGATDVGWWWPFWGGTFNFVGYWLVLWAYQLSERASYVVAFRQFSIVIGVILAFILYKERGMAVRLAATGLIAAGLVVIGVWG